MRPTFFLYALTLAALHVPPARASDTAPSTPSTPPSKARSTAAAIQWPLPAGFREETLAFPLDFAPRIPHQGVELLRFAPGFFEPAAPGYWSYAFAWVLEDRAPLTYASLQNELRMYFAGLCDAVGGKKFHLDPARYRVQLDGDAATGMTGTADLYDAFKTGKPLSLHLAVHILPCGGRRVVLFTATPQPHDHAMAVQLTSVAAALRCAI